MEEPQPVGSQVIGGQVIDCRLRPLIFYEGGGKASPEKENFRGLSTFHKAIFHRRRKQIQPVDIQTVSRYQDKYNMVMFVVDFWANKQKLNEIAQLEIE